MSVSQIFRRFPPLELQLGPGFAKSHIVNVFRIRRRLREEREREILASLSNPVPVVVLKAKKSPGCVFNTFPPPFLVRATSGVASPPPPPPNDDRRRRRRIEEGKGEKGEKEGGTATVCVPHKASPRRPMC